MPTWFGVASAGWILAMTGLIADAIRRLRLRRGTLRGSDGVCIARGEFFVAGQGTLAGAGHTTHALFGTIDADRVWFARVAPGTKRITPGPIGVLHVGGDVVRYEARLGFGSLAWISGIVVFFIAAAVAAGAWLSLGAVLFLALALAELRRDARSTELLAIEVFGALSKYS